MNILNSRLSRIGSPDSKKFRISFHTIYVMLKTLKRRLLTVIDVIQQRHFKWDIEYGSYKVALKLLDLVSNWIINVLAHM